MLCFVIKCNGGKCKYSNLHVVSYIQCELSYSYIVVKVEGHDSKLLHTYFVLGPIATQNTGKRQFNSSLGKFWENTDFRFMAKNQSYVIIFLFTFWTDEYFFCV